MLKIITKGTEMANNSKRKIRIGFNPVTIVFVIGYFHIIVSIALLLYLLYSYLFLGYVSTMIIAVLMIWAVGASVIMSLGLIFKYLVGLI